MMSTRRPERPKLTPHRESIVPEIPPPGAPAPAVEPAPEPAPPASGTVSIRTDAELIKQWHQAVRQLHASTGQQKGVIAAALLRHALAAVDDVAAELSTE